MSNWLWLIHGPSGAERGFNLDEFQQLMFEDIDGSEYKHVMTVNYVDGRVEKLGFGNTEEFVRFREAIKKGLGAKVAA